MKKLLSVTFIAAILLTACSPKVPTANDFQKFLEDSVTSTTDGVKSLYDEVTNVEGFKEAYDTKVEEAKKVLDDSLSKLDASAATAKFEEFKTAVTTEIENVGKNLDQAKEEYKTWIDGFLK